MLSAYTLSDCPPAKKGFKKGKPIPQLSIMEFISRNLEGRRAKKDMRPGLTYERIFTDSVFEVMERMLGESGAKSVIFQLGLLPVINNPYVLHSKLISTFGYAGAERLEKGIMSELYLRLGLIYKADDPINDLGQFDLETCFGYAKLAFNLRHK